MQTKIPCFKCGESLQLGRTIGFKECCPKCDADLHCCKNCHFYDSNSYNECKETQADRIVDKEKANFCDYFRIASKIKVPGFESIDPKAKARNSLDDLFKK